MCIAANKIPGVRAAPCHDDITAEISRRHNDLNVLCLSGDLWARSWRPAGRNLAEYAVRGRASRPSQSENRGHGRPQRQAVSLLDCLRSSQCP